MTKKEEEEKKRIRCFNLIVCVHMLWVSIRNMNEFKTDNIIENCLRHFSYFLLIISIAYWSMDALLKMEYRIL